MASARSIFQQCSDEFARRQEIWAREWYRACIEVTSDRDMDAQTSHQTSKVANYEILGPKVPHCFSSLFARRYGLIAATSIHMNSACHAGPRSSRDWASPPPPAGRAGLLRKPQHPVYNRLWPTQLRAQQAPCDIRHVHRPGHEASYQACEVRRSSRSPAHPQPGNRSAADCDASISALFVAAADSDASIAVLFVSDDAAHVPVLAESLLDAGTDADGRSRSPWMSASSSACVRHGHASRCIQRAHSRPLPTCLQPAPDFAARSDFIARA